MCEETIKKIISIIILENYLVDVEVLSYEISFDNNCKLYDCKLRIKSNKANINLFQIKEEEIIKKNKEYRLKKLKEII